MAKSIGKETVIYKHGAGFQLESGFWNTPAGKRHFENCKQNIVNMLNGMDTENEVVEGGNLLREQEDVPRLQAGITVELDQIDFFIM